MNNLGILSSLDSSAWPTSNSAIPLSLVMNVKGAEASWEDAVLSFSVTEQALTSDGVVIELCSGRVGEQDLVACGTIPGDVTMQLICRLRSKLVERGRNPGGAATASDTESLAVEVRLFGTHAGKDAGVCSLNLNFRPDEGNETSNEIEGPNLLQGQAHREPETPAVAPEAVVAATSAQERGIPEGAGHRQSSLTLLEETARHIEAIEEVQFRHKLRPSLTIKDAGTRKQSVAL